MSEKFTLGVNYWPRRKAMYWWSNFDAGEVLEEFTVIRINVHEKFHVHASPPVMIRLLRSRSSARSIRTRSSHPSCEYGCDSF